MEERVKMLEEIQHKIYIQRWSPEDKNSIKVELNFKEAEFLLSAIRSAIIWETRIGSFAEDKKIETRCDMLNKLEIEHFRQKQESKDNSITFDFNDKEWEFLYTALSSVSVWEERIEHFIDKRPKAKWEETSWHNEIWGTEKRCSNCGFETLVDGKYCTNCGAKMENKENIEDILGE